jgi:pilus assembly protein Flp/PilA
MDFTNDQAPNIKQQKRNTKRNTNNHTLTQKENAKMIKKLINFFKDEEGASMVEYGLLVALIAVVVMGAVALIGTDMNAKFTAVDAKLK